MSESNEMHLAELHTQAAYAHAAAAHEHGAGDRVCPGPCQKGFGLLR